MYCPMYAIPAQKKVDAIKNKKTVKKVSINDILIKVGTTPIELLVTMWCFQP